MHVSPLEFATLVEALLEAALFGVYAVLFATVVYLFRSRDRRPANIILAGLVLQFLTLTAHWSTSLYRILHIVGWLSPQEAEEFLSQLSSKSYLVDLSLSGAVFCISNLLVIHRVYVVCSRRLPFIIPALAMLLGEIISEIVLVYSVGKTWAGQSFVQLFALSNPWVTTALSTSIMISVYSTVIISWKILRVARVVKLHRAEPSTTTSLTTALVSMAESAALQTAATITLLVTYQIGIVVQVIFNGIVPVIAGISTVLIYARVGLGWAYGGSEVMDPGQRSTELRISFAPALTLPLDDINTGGEVGRRQSK
ncbi:hypothetical protein MIND_01309600 [Mycena indigotica]|uniref:Uncharacterized protein n=1 Tax=Mycena indigotica TaxID=2126181 RepID=A0A8H6S1P1_9AGAR|nr:uncharacterized protein MIND_01309600 [Mycena indigotica]KAF7290693.1 hypothetical protein MIND_01309600 [Mycena indigotica]